ncbi:hypothetical protein SRABI106_01416 [Rahnella aquatilis]|nr:hypothetical protein SRABI106_01416 [Rahnella aquatilis]
MKFENEDAYNLARDYMGSKAEKLNADTYFIRFIENYRQFDEWLKNGHPSEPERKSLNMNPDLIAAVNLRKDRR